MLRCLYFLGENLLFTPVLDFSLTGVEGGADPEEVETVDLGGAGGGGLGLVCVGGGGGGGSSSSCKERPQYRKSLELGFFRDFLTVVLGSVGFARFLG